MNITKDSILSKVTAYDILNHFLHPYNTRGGNLTAGQHISNPFLREKQQTPSFNLYFSSQSRDWRFKDFATGDDGSCFDLVMKLYSCSFPEALEHINSMMSLGLTDDNAQSILTPSLHASVNEIAFPSSSLRVRGFTHKELAWWLQYGITVPVLDRFHLSSVETFSAKNRDGRSYTITSNDNFPVYAYIHHSWAKLYKPLDTKFRFQYLGNKPENFLFGMEQLPDFSEYIFITGGEKDVMSLAAHGLSAVSLNSETANLPAETLKTLQSRCKHVMILYDIDATGKAQSEKLSKQHGLKKITLPDMPDGKDISDFFRLKMNPETINELASAALVPGVTAPIPVPDISRLDKVLKTREVLAVNKSQKIIFSNPILSQNENPVFFPKTINVLQGKAGVHKSRLAQIICSSLLKTPECSKEFLGFHADIFKSYAICYVDTERNLSEQLPYALQQIQVMAGYEIEDNPDNFDYISLLEFERKERFEVLNEYLEHVRTKYSRHIFIVLDVITDCVYNFNDAKDSMALIDMMNITINRYDVTFLCLIHENPGSVDKARGHLGTEIMNKASTVIQVGFEKDSERKEMDLVKVAYLKCRSSKKHEPFYVQYSDEDNSLVLADQDVVFELMQHKKQKASSLDIIEKIEIILSEPLSRREILSQLCQEFSCTERLMDDRLREIIDTKAILRDKDYKDCHLVKEKQGKTLIYRLQPISLELF
jgi:hypothetical protein